MKGRGGGGLLCQLLIQAWREVFGWTNEERVITGHSESKARARARVCVLGGGGGGIPCSAQVSGTA